METRGGRVHHAYGRCAPYIRNSRTIHAVPMHHHPRFCCSLGAAYAPEGDGRYNSLCGRALSAQAIGRIMGRTKDTVKMSLDCVGGCKQKGSASFLYTFRMFHGIMDAEYGQQKV